MPTVNDEEYQHALIDVRMSSADGLLVASVTFSKISCIVKVPKLWEGYESKDAQGQVRTFTIGNQVITASISMLFSEYRAIRDQLNHLNPKIGILQQVMDWSISFGNSLQNLRTDNWSGVMFQEDPIDSSTDQNALDVDLPLFVQGVAREGGPSVVYRSY